MNFLTDFCYICFDYNDKLKDILKLEAESLELFGKLKQLVSEVEWSTNKKLFLCEKCIKKLNTFFKFKKQCVDSSEALKLFLSDILSAEEDENKRGRFPINLYKNDMDREIFKKYMQLIEKGKAEFMKQTKTSISTAPDQNIFPAFTKLIVSNSNQPNSFQNVFLNILPSGKNNDKGMLINIGQVFPLTPPPPPLTKRPEEPNLCKILNTSRTEEISIDMDPQDFTNMSDNEEKGKDWDEIILNTQNNNELPNKQESILKPLLPKLDDSFDNYTNEEKMDFFNSGHFLLQDTVVIPVKNYCDKCRLHFDTVKLLNIHIKQVHSTDIPYKCEYCNLEFNDKELLKLHLKKHANEVPELVKNSITLNDFKSNSYKVTELLKKTELQKDSVKKEEPQNLEEKCQCDDCPRKFSSLQGLVNHRAKKHKSADRKKYFIKGMKNAKCDVCNRMFSTNSYLNLHKKLHNRKGEIGMKIFKNSTDKEVTTAQEEEGAMDVDMDASELNNGDDTEMEIKEESDTEEQDIEEEREVVQEKSPSIKLKIRFKDIEQSTRLEEEDEELEEEEVEEDDDNNESNEQPNTPNLSEFLETNLEESISVLRDSDVAESRDGADRNGVYDFEYINGKPQCSYCQKLFGRKHDLKRHIKNVHLKTIQYKCHLCEKFFYEGFHLTRHLRSHCSIMCKECDRVFFFTLDLKNHILAEHENTGMGYCGLCMKDFHDFAELSLHNEHHLQSIKYNCHLCPEVFVECRVLSKHLLEHYDCVNFACNICKVVLPNEAELVEHVATHTPRFRCEICLTSYKKKRYLQQHIKNNHVIGVQSVEVIINKSEDVFSDDSS